MLKVFKFILLLLHISIFISCVSASDEDNFDEISVGKIPLKSGNKWVYDISRGNENFTDSAEILECASYPIDELTNKFLYQYKEIPLTLEMATEDTIRIKLIEYDNNTLIQYGTENRDKSVSHFIYGEPVIFSEPQIILDHESISVEEIDINSLKIMTGSVSRTLRDTLINCIKTNIVQVGSSYITTALTYNLDFYYSEFGILKIEGIVNNSEFSAQTTKCVFK